MSKVIGFLVIIALTACTDDAVDPVGRYTLTFRWGSGSCDITGTTDGDYQVADFGSVFQISDNDDPSAACNGSITCDASRCDIVFTQTSEGIADDGTAFALTIRHNWVLNDSHQVDGSGSVAVRNQVGQTCNQQFTMDGVVR